MTAQDFIIERFCKVDDQMQDVAKHSQASLWPSEVFTIGLLHTIKGVGNRAFYRWLSANHRELFPQLLERTRLFRLLCQHQEWTNHFLAQPSLLGVIDTYGIELIHPVKGRTQCLPDWQERQFQLPLDCGRQALPGAQSLGAGGSLGLCYGQCS